MSDGRYTDQFVKEKFAKSDKWVGDNLIFEVIMGSQAYGCNTVDSDYDIVGVFMNKHEHLFPQSYDRVLGFDELPNLANLEFKGEKNRIVFENGKDCKGEWHSLTNFFFLASKHGSPNMIETLFTKRNLITYALPMFWNI